MPFYAKDWRSPGEVWVKTIDGWEKQKILECRQKSPPRFNKSTDDDDKENCTSSMMADDDRQLQLLDNYKDYIPPHCQITLKCTKEIAGFNGLSDALRRLDFRSAVHDQRRFPYTAKLLDLLLSQQRITTLSGCAQKTVLNVLEGIAVQAQSSQQNTHVLSKLLRDLRRSVRGDSWWGQPLGSSLLWGQHVQTIDRIDAIASSIGSDQSKDSMDDDVQSEDGDERLKFQDLPEECVREILFRLADHKDLLNTAEAYSLAQKIGAEQRLWRRLCRFHFTPMQISFIQSEMEKEREKAARKSAEVSGAKVGNSPSKSTNRNSTGAANNRTGHPYFNSNNNTNGNSIASCNSGGGNSSRSSSARGSNLHDPNKTSSEEDNDNQTWFLDSSRQRVVRVSEAFHEHLNQTRESLQQQQQPQQLQQQQLDNAASDNQLNLDGNQRISFQDVRNHFDQRINRQNSNEATSQRIRKPLRSERIVKNDNQEPSADWEDVYHRLRRQFGLREQYAEVLHLCRTCRCLFWKTFGHPCIADRDGSNNNSSGTDADSLYVPVPPQAFLKFFSL